MNFKSFSKRLFLLGITFILVQNTSSFFEFFFSDFFIKIKLLDKAFNLPKLPNVFLDADSLLLFFSLLKEIERFSLDFSLLEFNLDFIGVSFWADFIMEDWLLLSSLNFF